jgi:hypothetical protein
VTEQKRSFWDRLFTGNLVSENSSSRQLVNRGNPGLLALYRRKTIPLTSWLFAAIVKE